MLSVHCLSTSCITFFVSTFPSNSLQKSHVVADYRCFNILAFSFTPIDAICFIMPRNTGFTGTTNSNQKCAFPFNYQFSYAIHWTIARNLRVLIPISLKWFHFILFSSFFRHKHFNWIDPLLTLSIKYEYHRMWISFEMESFLWRNYFDCGQNWQKIMSFKAPFSNISHWKKKSVWKKKIEMKTSNSFFKRWSLFNSI